MPMPKSDESQDDYMPRCIAEVVGEGKSQDEAVAMCSTMWENRNNHNMRAIRHNMERLSALRDARQRRD